MRGLVIGALKGDARSQMTLFRLAEQTGQFEQPPEPLREDRADHHHRRPRRDELMSPQCLRTANQQGRAHECAGPPTRWSAGRSTKLIPYARNARTHSDAQVDQIAASIREWGWTNPVLVAEDGTHHRRPRPGAGRAQAAHRRSPGHGGDRLDRGAEEGLRDRRQQARRSTPAGTRSCSALEIGELQELGFDLDLIGFSRGGARRARLARQRRA